MLNNRTGDRKTVIGAGATPNLVKDDQTMTGRMMNDGSGLFHLDHKGALAGGDIVLSSNTRKDTVNQPDTSLASWHKTSNLCQQGNQGHLTQIRRFARHVGASQ